MKKKVFRSVLLALLALSLMTSVAYAYTIKTVTVRMYKHEDVDTADSTLKSYTRTAMTQIMYAVWYGGGQDTQLFYSLKGPYVHDNWAGEYTCSMDPNGITGYAVYFLEGFRGNSYADCDGGHAVVELDPQSSCGEDSYFYTPPKSTTVHELGHVFGARDRHGTDGDDVMDQDDAQVGIYTFDTPSKTNIANYVEGEPDELN